MKKKTPFCNAIKYELLAFEKQHARKPKAIVMNSNMADKLWLEIMPFVYQTEEAVFENPKNGYRRFMGVDIIVCNIIYGGDFKWALGD